MLGRQDLKRSRYQIGVPAISPLAYRRVGPTVSSVGDHSMPNRNKFTPPPIPPDFEELAPFRENFLRRFSDEDAERFRRLGGLVFQAFLEGALVLPQEFPESDTWREAKAALQDARFAQHCLAMIAESLVDSALEPDDSRIALAAADFSVELGKLCDRLEAVLK